MVCLWSFIFLLLSGRRIDNLPRIRYNFMQKITFLSKVQQKIRRVKNERPKYSEIMEKMLLND